MPARLLHRRDVLAGLAAAVAGPAWAQDARVPVGAAVNHHVLGKDAPYRAALARHCDVVVSESAMKWSEQRPSRGVFNFAEGDATVAFARSMGLKVRGHTLVWCEGTPDWLKSLANATEAERELRAHIERTVAHYQTTIDDWDIVNEPIATKPTQTSELRGGVWPEKLGPRYIDIAFRTAAEVAPRQRRVLNEYGVEHVGDRVKREAFRRLVLDLGARGVPLTGVGLQGHLDGAREIDTDGVAAFCAEMNRAGLDVLVTELDVNDQALPGSLAERDAVVAKRTEAFLAAVFAGCRPKLVCTWGLSDRYTWIPMWFKRRDGLANRPLPLDADFAEKPMARVVQRFARAGRGG